MNWVIEEVIELDLCQADLQSSSVSHTTDRSFHDKPALCSATSSYTHPESHPVQHLYTTRLTDCTPYRFHAECHVRAFG